MKTLHRNPITLRPWASAARPARITALAVLLLLAAGCAAPDGAAVPEDPDVILVFEADAEDLPPEPTVLDRLADYHGLDLDPVEHARLLSQEGPGAAASAELIQEVLEESGFAVFTFRGTLDDAPTGIRYNLDLGRPLLLLLEREGGKGAWVLIVGYDDPTQVYVTQRAGGGIAGLHYADLQRDWSAAGQITILALPDISSEP